MNTATRPPLPAAPALRAARPDAFGADQAFGAWLTGHKDAMVRWSLVHVGNPLNTPNPLARRAFAEESSAVQTRQGTPRFVTWMFGAMLLAAHQRQPDGGLAEPMLAGLPPELRGVLRLVGRGEMSPIEAWGLLQQPFETVRHRLLRARLQPGALSHKHQRH